MNFVIFDIAARLADDGTPAGYSLEAAMWQPGGANNFYTFTDCPATGDESADLARHLAQFLRLLEGCQLVAPAIQDKLSLARRACEDAGYEFPWRDGVDLVMLERILWPTADAGSSAPGPTTAGAEPRPASAAELHERFDRCVTRATELPYATLQELERLAGLFSRALADWFADAADTRFRHCQARLPDHCDMIQQLAFSKPEEPMPVGNPDAAGAASESPLASGLDAVALFASDSPLGAVLDRFEVREGQQRMVRAVAESLEGDQHLLAEAGTGTGKSLAYLIPAALHALNHQSRVIVATHTIALQDQISRRDFPILQRIVYQPLSLSVFKGRTHYVCMRKLRQEAQSANFASPQDDVESYMRLLVWLLDTPEGNREELQLRSRLAEVWPRVQSETETCINKRCPFFKACYYFRARNKAFNADIVVTNHSLVMSDLKANHRVLPKYDKLVIDEAHHLEEEATKHLGEEVHLFQCLALFGRLVRDNGKHGVIPELVSRLQGSDTPGSAALPALERLADTLRGLRSTVEQTFAALARWVPAGSTEYRFTAEVESHPAWADYLALCDDLYARLRDLDAHAQTLLDAADLEPDEDLAGRLVDAAGFVLELAKHLQLLAGAGDLSPDWVTWIEVGGSGERPQISLYRAPVDVAPILQAALFDSKSSVILTSATLSVAGTFDYVKKRLGLTDAERDGRLLEVSVPSPFRYDRQALLCVPTDVPELAKLPTHEAAVWLSAILCDLALISQGRLLALFTSHALLRATADLLRTGLATRGIQLLAQGIDGNRTYLLDAFRQSPNSVLLGAQSFWEGIDLPGDQLTTLVIVRLPFSPPTHPVTQARHELITAQGANPFSEASLPEAVVRFRQGFGRLIRTAHDRGVVVVLDKRIVTARYGSSFIKSIDGARTCIRPEREVLEQIREFLHSGPEPAETGS